MSERQISERELKVLEIIYRHQETIRQRNLSQIVGLSLGVTNAIVKRLAQKGLLKIRKINNRNIHYIVSAEGVDAIARRSYRYIKRTIKNIILYKEAIERLIENVKAEGYTRLVLIGTSDIDFIIEQSCFKLRLPFSKSNSVISIEGIFCIYGEDHGIRENTIEKFQKTNVVFLRELLLNSTG